MKKAAHHKLLCQLGQIAPVWLVYWFIQLSLELHKFSSVISTQLGAEYFYAVFLLANWLSADIHRCIGCSGGRSRVSSRSAGVWREQGLRFPDLAAAQRWWSFTCAGILCGTVRIAMYRLLQIFHWVQMNRVKQSESWHWKFISDLWKLADSVGKSTVHWAGVYPVDIEMCFFVYFRISRFSLLKS